MEQSMSAEKAAVYREAVDYLRSNTTELETEIERLARPNRTRHGQSDVGDLSRALLDLIGRNHP
jgi:hypothetical protein